MRTEAHKLTGTAATFGLLRLGHLSSALSSALKNDDARLATQLARQVAHSAAEGVGQLRTYSLAFTDRA
jgi:HPt (histidine-containing phosphotransfer) domain-containing protein